MSPTPKGSPMGSKNSKNYKRPKPRTLDACDLESVAKYIASSKCKNVFLMLGAGLYANLARLNLPYPEAVFEINFFKKNPVPFYTLAHELYPGKFRPTITHSFVRLLAEHSLLHTCFTQNIDTLERQAGVPDDKIIEAHGSFASQRCIECSTSYDGEKMRQKIMDKEIARCEKCKYGLVKPDIVFFGESLPDKFVNSVSSLSEADLLIVIGTSLTVHPFASLANLVPELCPRVLINIERVGDFGRRADDVVLLGKCDDVVKDLCQELGWQKELGRLWKETEETTKPPRADPQFGDDDEEEADDLYNAEKLKDEVDEITSRIGEALALDEPTSGQDKQATSASPLDEPETKTAMKESVVQGQKLPTAVVIEEAGATNEGDKGTVEGKL